MTFSDDKIGIGIIVRNHLGISHLAKSISRMGHQSWLWGTSSYHQRIYHRLPLSVHIVIENDLLLTINSLTTIDEDTSELDALSSRFCDSIDISSIFFSHVDRSGNSPVHLLARATLVSDIAQAWIRNIQHDVSRVIMFDFNNI